MHTGCMARRWAATLILAGWLLAFERRRWVKGLGVLAVVAVVVQGVLGGTRVTEVSTVLAAVHGAMGQAFFGLLVVLCVLTGRSWSKARPPVVDSERLRPRVVVNLVLVVAQIGVGSWLRHYGSRSALVAHGLLGLAVWAHILFFSWRVGAQSIDSNRSFPPNARLPRRRLCKLFLVSWRCFTCCHSTVFPGP